MSSYIDLHIHSTASDGTFTPNEIVSLAKEKGLQAIALTDHDTTEGIKEFMLSGSELEIETIPGIELGALYNGREIHIVGLFIDCSNTELINYIAETKKIRDLRNEIMLKNINDAGFNITFDDVAQAADGEIITRAHYAKVMAEKHYVKDKNQAFDKYLGDGKPLYVTRQLPSAEECIKIIIKSGGCPILAHPTLYNMNYRQIRTMCANLMEYGLEGIEVMYSTYRHEQEREITRIATDLGLKFSGGSDFHGQNKPEIRLGTGRGNLAIPYEFIEKINL